MVFSIESQLRCGTTSWCVMERKFMKRERISKSVYSSFSKKPTIILVKRMKRWYLVYRSQLNEQDLRLLLVDFQRRDAQTQYSNAGTHKDDLLFQIKLSSVKKFGSQGQQKSYLIALRLAQFGMVDHQLKAKANIVVGRYFLISLMILA